jgi:hypothetical protein
LFFLHRTREREEREERERREREKRERREVCFFFSGRLDFETRKKSKLQNDRANYS